MLQIVHILSMWVTWFLLQLLSSSVVAQKQSQMLCGKTHSSGQGVALNHSLQTLSFFQLDGQRSEISFSWVAKGSEIVLRSWLKFSQLKRMTSWDPKGEKNNVSLALEVRKGKLHLKASEQTNVTEEGQKVTLQRQFLFELDPVDLVQSEVLSRHVSCFKQH